METLVDAVVCDLDVSAAEYEAGRDGEQILVSDIRLLFDCGELELKNPFRLRCDSGEAVDPHALLGCRVTDAYDTDTDLVWVFDGRILLSVSRREEDYLGPAAAILYLPSGQVINLN